MEGVAPERLPWLGKATLRVIAGAAETGGALSVLQIDADRGYVAAAHRHEREDELFTLLQGSMRGADVAAAALCAAVDALMGLPVTSLTGMALIELARLVETQARRLPRHPQPTPRVSSARRWLRLPRLRHPTHLDRDQLTLLCGFHHREHERMGWECHMTDGGPEWLPPPWIDPDRTPQRNRTHHIADYQSDAA